MIPPPLPGVILAGGQSTRMGTEKALMPLAGRPVLAHVIERLQPQVAQIFLNANGDTARFAGFGLAIVPDDPAFPLAGPLAGVLAALEFAAQAGFDDMAAVPCDAPFLPPDMVARLAASRQPGEVACCASTDGIEPLFALWPIAAAPALRAFLQNGGRRARDAVMGLPHHVVTYPARADQPNFFLNLNRPGDAEIAAKWITQK